MVWIRRAVLMAMVLGTGVKALSKSNAASLVHEEATVTDAGQGCPVVSKVREPPEEFSSSLCVEVGVSSTGRTAPLPSLSSQVGCPLCYDIIEQWNADGKPPARVDTYCTEIAHKWKAMYETLTGKAYVELRERTRVRHSHC